MPSNKSPGKSGAARTSLFTLWKQASFADLPVEAKWTMEWFHLTSARCDPCPPTIDPWRTLLNARNFGQAKARGHLLHSLVAKEVTENQSLIEQQPAYALLAIQMVSRAGVPVPDWLAAVYSESVDKLSHQQCGSLDEAFRHKGPTQRTLLTDRDRGALAASVYNSVLRHVLVGHRLDVGLFECVAAELDLGKTKCTELYQHATQDMGCVPLSALTKILRSLKKRRASIA